MWSPRTGRDTFAIVLQVCLMEPKTCYRLGTLFPAEELHGNCSQQDWNRPDCKWFVYVIFERYHDPMPETSPVFAAIALTTAFVGLVVVALGEVCRSLQAIESNTRKQI
jgi:hypothetical protein